MKYIIFWSKLIRLVSAERRNLTISSDSSLLLPDFKTQMNADEGEEHKRGADRHQSFAPGQPQR